MRKFKQVEIGQKKAQIYKEAIISYVSIFLNIDFLGGV